MPDEDDNVRLHLVTTRKGAALHGEPQAAAEFVALVEAGASLQDASDQTGVSQTNKLVQDALQVLGIYAKLGNEVFRGFSEGRMKAIVLHGEPRDAIAAHKALYPEPSEVSVEVNISSDLAKMDVTLPGLPLATQKESV